MGSINIRRDVNDVFYRYKMPALMAKIEGKGNGIKTVIPNMLEVAKSLNRPPSYPTKFFGCELGAQVMCDDKVNRYIVNGVHETHKLQDLLDIFISKFVLCPACKNPETELVIAKDGNIYTKCKACGQKKPISDQQHRLVPFIQRNVPQKPKKALSEKPAPSTGTAEMDDHIMVSLSLPSRHSNVADVDEDWAEDMSESAVAKRREEQIERMSKVLRDHVTLDAPILKHSNGTNDDNNEEDDDNGADVGESGSGNRAAEAFGTFLEENCSVLTSDTVLKKISELKIKNYKALVVLPQVLFAKSTKIADDIEIWLGLLQDLCIDEKCQKNLIGGIERLVMMINKDLQRKLPIILQKLYQGDILTEQILLYWADHPSKKYIGDRQAAKDMRVSAAPFIEWLRQASEASGASEASDDE